MSNNPFSRNRMRADLISASPAIGMLAGLVVGAFFGWFFSLDPTSGSIISGAGMGLIAGLLVGLIIRAVKSQP